MKQRVYIYTLIDALGWSLVSGRGFLDDIMRVKTPVNTLLGFSSALIPSILTGKTPAEHGHWNLFYLSRNGSSFKWLETLGVLPEFMIENRLSRKLIQKIAQKWSGYQGYFYFYDVPIRYLPYFDICEKHDIYQPHGIGNTLSIFDILVEESVGYRCYNYHQFSDKGIFDEVREDLDSKDYTFLFLYLAELDHFLHFHCKDAELVNKKLDWYEQRIRELYESALKNYKEVSLTVFSDHGMTPITSHFDLMSEVEKLNLYAGKDYLPMYDSTMARFWFFSQNAREQITASLIRLNVGRVLPKGELEGLGVYFPDGRYGELIFLMKPGCLIEPGFMGGKILQGMHGFHPEEPTSCAMFMTTEGNVSPPENVTGFFKLMRASIRPKVRV
ncbi:MAG TPA: alkaline phosphatase family protein [Candidatus Hypogeohydataceae bacterium YC41]